MALSIQNNSVIVNFTDEVNITDYWEMGGFKIKFVRLLPSEELRITPGDYVKVIHGMLIDPLRLSMPGPFEKSTTVMNEDIIKSANESILMIVSNKYSVNDITSPSQLVVQGPYCELLTWKQVSDLPWGSKFEGVEFYNIRGWDVRGPSGKHVAYVQGWLAGPGVNCGNHNHHEMNEDTFRELHLCIRNGSGLGGMVWIKDGEDYTLPLLNGEEHGPFWTWSEDLTKVVYPIHRWQSGPGAEFLDFWFSIELPPLKAAYNN